MKQSTIDKLNKLVVGYLSITGLSNRKMREDNPINIYFSQTFMMKLNDVKEKEVDEVDEVKKEFQMSYGMFYAIISECIKLYKKTDSLTLKKNVMIKKFISDIMQTKDFDIDAYIIDAINQFKDTLYSLLRYYNSKHIIYNKLKLDFLEYKMWEFAECEKYADAAMIREKIKDVQERIETTTLLIEQQEKNSEEKNSEDED